MKTGNIQYNIALAITDAIKATYQMEVYNKLGLESLNLDSTTLSHLKMLQQSIAKQIYSNILNSYLP